LPNQTELVLAILAGLFGLLAVYLAYRLQRKQRVVEYDIYTMPLILFEPFSDEKAWFGAFAIPRIRIAWKGDVLNPQGNTLDNTQREGGWGSLSERMKKVAGGLWTARSLKSVEGLVAVAESFGGRVS
jgi:hypothetical protein